MAGSTAWYVWPRLIGLHKVNEYRLRSIDAVALLLLLLAATGSSGAEPDRLLPTTQQQKIGVSATQDGRAVDVTIVNGSDLVVTGGEVVCRAVAVPPPPVAPGCPDPILGVDVNRIVAEVMTKDSREKRPKAAQPARSRPGCTSDPYIRDRPVVLKKRVDAKILPGRSSQLYAEVEGAVALDSCNLVDPRGRERRLLDGI